jgi:hypothetical protein
VLDRAIRATKLDAELYEEVEANPALNQEALMVVVAASVLSGIGSMIDATLLPPEIPIEFRPSPVGSLLFGVISGVLGYYVWSYVTYFVGTRLMDGTSDPGEMLRAIGYAQAPRALGVFAFIPVLGGLIALAGGLLTLAAGVVAVRQALDFTTGKAIVTVLVGWLVMIVLTILIAIPFGVAAGVGALLGGMSAQPVP